MTPDLSRDPAIDVLRGLAIVVMVAANLAATLLAEPHPLALRVITSFAAPIFLGVAGLMVTATAERRGRTLGWFLRRGLALLAVAAACDVAIYQLWPFVTVDILYPIAVGLPLAYLFRRLPLAARGAVLGLLVGATPVLQVFLGYADYPKELYLDGTEVAGTLVTPVWNHWIVDGWFPLVPWLGFLLAGAWAGEARFSGAGIRPFSRGFLGVAALVLVVGGVGWFLWPGAMYSRLGFSELFYPPTAGFLLASAAFIPLLLRGIDALSAGHVAWTPLRALGMSPLVAYVLHLALARYALTPRYPNQPTGDFLLLYAVVLVVLLAAAFGTDLLRRRFGPLPWAARFILGG